MVAKGTIDQAPGKAVSGTGQTGPGQSSQAVWEHLLGASLKIQNNHDGLTVKKQHSSDRYTYSMGRCSAVVFGLLFIFGIVPLADTVGEHNRFCHLKWIRWANAEVLFIPC